MINIAKIGTRTLSRGLLISKKYSPEILTGVGIVGVVTAGVLAARATLKLEPIVDQLNEDLEFVNDLGLAEDYEEATIRREKLKVYATGVGRIVKLYGPSVTLGAGSIFCIVAANGIARKRNLALVAGYKALEQSFTEYRKRVVEEFGEEKDNDIYHGIKSTTKTVNGKKVTTKTIDTSSVSQYSRIFDRSNPNWQVGDNFNVMWLKMHQSYLNDRLKQRGHVFLNDVYDLLGMDRSSAGAIVGWVYNQNNGDDYIDFGIDDMRNIHAGAVLDGTEGHILLDFNVDGIVYDLI